MWKHTTLLVPLALVVAAHAELMDDVRCREIGFSQAAENRDREQFRSFIDTDARFVGESVLRGPDAIVGAWAAFLEPDGPAIQWRPEFVEVLEDSSLALTRGPYRVVSQDESGKVTEQWGTFNSVWRLNQDGEWRVVFDAGSPSSEPPADAKRAMLDAEPDCN